MIFFNYRSDRGRQLTTVLCEEDKTQLGMKSLISNFYTLTNYDESFKVAKPIFKNKKLKNTLGEVISNNNIFSTKNCRNRKISSRNILF